MAPDKTDRMNLNKAEDKAFNFYPTRVLKKEICLDKEFPYLSPQQ